MPTEPPGHPVAELIVQDVQDTLKGVTLSNGYSVNVTGTGQPENIAKPLPNKGVQVEVQDNGDEILEEGFSNGRDDIIMNLVVACSLNKADNNPTPANQMNRLIFAGIRDALTEDETRGGLAWKTTCPDWRRREDGVNGLVITVRVHLQTNYNDLFTQ